MLTKNPAEEVEQPTEKQQQQQQVDYEEQGS